MSKDLGSRFWMDKIDGFKNIKLSELSPTEQAIILVSYKHCVSNFVTILTGRSDINVIFSGEEESYTDGKIITISSKLNDNEIDVTIGLVLHEASHILLSSFDIIQNRKYWKLQNNLESVFILDILNVIEDRRCDKFVYTTCPGYADYYHALYKYYFLRDDIKRILRDARIDTCSSNKQTVVQAYITYILAMIHDEYKCTDLYRLSEIDNLIDLSNISRLTNTVDTLKLAIEVGAIIEEITSKLDDKTMPSQSLTSTPFIKKHREIHTGEFFKKSKVGREVLRELSNLNAGNISGNVNNSFGEGSNLIHVTALNVHCNTYAEFIRNQYFNSLNSYNKVVMLEAVNSGKALGKKLADELTIQNESFDSIYNRQKRGKLYQKDLYLAGCGRYDFFYKVIREMYSPITVHFTIDASGSMYITNKEVNPWYETIKLLSAMITVSEIINTFKITISFRQIVNNVACNLVTYESGKTNPNEGYKILTAAYPNSTTPEGLCYPALVDLYSKYASKQSYIINVSDGMPFATLKNMNYRSELAYKHTKDMWTNLLQETNSSGLSYFVTAKPKIEDFTTFTYMYGTCAENINFNKITQISKTINKMIEANITES